MSYYTTHGGYIETCNGAGTSYINTLYNPQQEFKDMMNRVSKLPWVKSENNTDTKVNKKLLLLK